jgi:hypothetical protein
MFDTEQKHRREAAAAEDASDFEWDYDGPGPNEKAGEQRVLVESFETLKNTKDAANEELWQQTARGRCGPLAAARRMERRMAEKLRRRDGDNNGAGRQPPRGATSSLGTCSSFLFSVCIFIALEL